MLQAQLGAQEAHGFFVRLGALHCQEALPCSAVLGHGVQSNPCAARGVVPGSGEHEGAAGLAGSQL